MRLSLRFGGETKAWWICNRGVWLVCMRTCALFYPGEIPNRDLCDIKLQKLKKYKRRPPPSKNMIDQLKPLQLLSNPFKTLEICIN